MSIKARIEAIIYAAEDPVTFEQIFALVKEEARAELEQRQHAEVAAKTEDDVTAEDVEQAEVPEGAALGEPTANAASSVNQAEANTEASVSVETQSEAATQAEPAEAAVAEAGEPEQQAEKPEPEPITDAEVKSALRAILEELMVDYTSPERGIEVRQIAGGFRMATKPEQHDVVRAFAKSLKPPIRLSLQALETLAVIAYKQPITAPEISEVRGVDAGGVLGTLLERKLITTAGRKQVIGRPILYKTTKEFLLRFGLKDIGELPSMEEFEKLAAESLGSDLFAAVQAPAEQPAKAGEAQEAALAEQTDSENPTPAEPETSATDQQPEVSAESTSADAAVAGTPVSEETPSEASEPQPAAEDAPAQENTPFDEAIVAEEPVAKDDSAS